MSSDKSAYSKFLEFHSHPKELSQKDLESLEQLIQEFPYCQSIKMLALKSAESTNRYNFLLQEASAFSSSRSILYDFIHQPELFFADLDMAKPSQDKHDNGLFESNNAFGINLNEIIGSEWHEEKIIEQPEEASEEITNAFGIDLSEILGSEFQEKKSVEKSRDLKIETKESMPDEVKVGDNAQEIIEETIPEESNDQLLQEQELVTNDKELETIENQSEEKIEDTELISEEVESEHIEEEINEEEPFGGKEDENSDQEEVEKIVEEEENISDSIAEENSEITPAVESVKVEEEKTIQEEITSSETPGTEVKTETVHEEEEVALETEAINDEIVSDEQDNLPIAESEKTEEYEIESSDKQSETTSEKEIEEEKIIKETESTEELESEVSTEEITAKSEEEIVEQEHIEFEETVENEAESASEKEINIDSTAPIAEESTVEAEGGHSTTAQIEKPILEEVENEVVNEDKISEEEQNESEIRIEKPIEQVENLKESAKKLTFESPVHSDFLTFADKENPKKGEEQKEAVTAYHDDTMPYTFLWWLNKTRKEYAESHQPYVKSKLSIILDAQQEIKKQEKDDLNHQIAENIFHLRGVEEFTGNSSRTPTVPFEFMRKDFQIIEKFIKEEPQIRPPAPNKIDTENKAKKSSEDSNEVVSETLAKIYVEQMLYHKALDVYKKLSLKFPEKSAYFASQIKYLELKVN